MRTAGMKALHSMLAATTSGRAKERDNRVWKNSGTPWQDSWCSETHRCVPVPVQLQRESGGQVDEKGDTHETGGYDITGAKERNLERHLRLRAPQTWVVLCASVDQCLRATQPTPMDINAVMSTCRIRNDKRGICGKMRHLKWSAGSLRKVMVKETRRQAMANERTCCGEPGQQKPDCRHRKENCGTCVKRGVRCADQVRARAPLLAWWKWIPTTRKKVRSPPLPSPTSPPSPHTHTHLPHQIDVGLPILTPSLKSETPPDHFRSWDTSRSLPNCSHGRGFLSSRNTICDSITSVSGKDGLPADPGNTLQELGRRCRLLRLQEESPKSTSPYLLARRWHRLQCVNWCWYCRRLARVVLEHDAKMSGATCGSQFNRSRTER